MQRTLLKNFISLAGAESVSKLVTFAAFAYLARLLGPSGYGYVEWAGAILMCSSLVVDQGLSSYGAREIARDPARTSTLISEIVTARILLAIVSYALLLAFAYSFIDEQNARNLVLVYGISLFALPFLFNWVFQGHDLMQAAGAVQLIRQLVFAAVVFAFVGSANNILMVGAAEIAGVTLSALVGLWALRKLLQVEINFRPKLSRTLFREGAPIGLSQIFWVAKMFGATLLIGLVATIEDTGYFAGAMRLLIAIHTFVWLYYFNLLPTMSRAWLEGRDALASTIYRSLRWATPVIVLTGLAWYLAAPVAMSFVYGPEFIQGGTALQWMAGVWVCAAVSGHFRFGLIAAGKQTAEMATAGIGAIIAVVLVPVGYNQFGISGAAAGLFAAEVTVLAASWIVIARVIRPNDQFIAVETDLDRLSEVSR